MKNVIYKNVLNNDGTESLVLQKTIVNSATQNQPVNMNMIQNNSGPEQNYLNNNQDMSLMKQRMMTYNTVTNENIPNRDNWTQRHSTRGSEYFKSLTEKGITVTRFDIYMTRQSLHLNSCYKDRSPADCKFLQQALKYEWGFADLPSNMMPMSHMEAILGAILAKENEKNPQKMRTLYTFRELDVIDIKEILNISSDVYNFENECAISN